LGCAPARPSNPTETLFVKDEHWQAALKAQRELAPQGRHRRNCSTKEIVCLLEGAARDPGAASGVSPGNVRP
jgi:hypothetical protein